MYNSINLSNIICTIRTKCIFPSQTGSQDKCSRVYWLDVNTHNYVQIFTAVMERLYTCFLDVWQFFLCVIIYSILYIFFCSVCSSCLPTCLVVSVFLDTQNCLETDRITKGKDTYRQSSILHNAKVWRLVYAVSIKQTNNISIQIIKFTRFRSKTPPCLPTFPLRNYVKCSLKMSEPLN